MRYRATEKLEVIRLVEQSSLSVRRTLAQLGIPRATFYRWYQRYLARRAASGINCRRRWRRQSSSWRSRNRSCRHGN